MNDVEKSAKKYEKILDALEATMSRGSRVVVKPSPALNNKGIINSDQTGRLQKNMWVVFEIHYLPDELTNIVRSEAELRQHGILFDKRLRGQVRDWYVDYSLTISD
jgi:hypothetical protein